MEIRHRIPSLSTWMECCYSCQPLLLLGKESIHSGCGVQQGDPLDPLGFALSLHPHFERIKAEVPGLALNSWYLDDGTLMGSLEDLAAALHIVERDGPPVGLHLNRSKSLLFIPEEVAAPNSPLPPDIPMARRGFCLLGCPIGPPDFCEEVFRDRIAKVKTALKALQDMGDSQLDITLLRSCLALPKVSFVLRACPPTHIHQAAAEFDYAVREALESTPWWASVGLVLAEGYSPQQYGRPQTSQHPAACLSCLHSCQLKLSVPGRGSARLSSQLVPAFATATAHLEWQHLEDIDIDLWQRALSHAIDEASFQHLLLSADSNRSRSLAL